MLANSMRELDVERNNQLDAHATLSFITFNSGLAAFAIPVKDVRYITAVGTLKIRTVPTREGLSRKVFDYGTESIVLYRFSDIVGSHSQVDESVELSKLLQQRRQDHVNWMDALEHSLKTGEPFSKALDPHKCAFGQWYDSFEAKDEELKDILRTFDSPHKHIHSLASKLIDKASTSDGKAEALKILAFERGATLQQLLNCFGRAIARLEELVKPVVLVLDGGKSTFALEVEKINDIIEFSEDDWLDDNADRDTNFHDGFFQAQGGQLHFNLLPGALLRSIERGETLDTNT